MDLQPPLIHLPFLWSDLSVNDLPTFRIDQSMPTAQRRGNFLGRKNMKKNDISVGGSLQKRLPK
jgi:hypothetical protein